MDVPGLIDQLEFDGTLMAQVIDGADLTTSVPGTDWDLRSLVMHTGAVHRWANDAITRQLATNETGGSAAFHSRVEDDQMPGWIADGLATLVATLRSCGDDLTAFTFLRSPTARHFWARRQAHETAIHRADAQAAMGDVTTFDPEFSQDGIAEIVAGFALQRSFASETPGVLALLCTDGPSWLVTFGGERNQSVQTDDLSAATATVTGTSSALYLWSWNRPAAVQVEGDNATIGLWQRIRI
ncbi:uncharacterized protein (TIGR03083 family) [Nakamurella sp. UYEF19]|uniref:maleylpyruvate isomerase family mycothiol-dependent enzyme n=1 Tax=Nakamurella sp. UYEF19 TaxID=1756392 RepID=UPI0033915DE1